MKLTRFAATTLLLVFVVATVRTLIAQEVGRPEHPSIADNECDLLFDNNDITSMGQPPSEPATQHTDLREGEGKALTEPSISSDSVAPAPLESDAAEMAEAACRVEAVYFHNTA